MSKQSSSGRAWQAIRQQVLERDGFVCVQCGSPATHVDHIVAKANGGTDDMDNLQAMCQTHNLKKGTKTTMRGTYWNTDVFPDGLPSPSN